MVEARARSVPSEARGMPSFFYVSAGVDKTITLVSIREALFYTYVAVKCRPLFALGSHELWAHSQDIRQVDSMHRAHRYNAAARTPCVCDAPVCAVLPWLAVLIGACGP